MVENPEESNNFSNQGDNLKGLTGGLAQGCLTVLYNLGEGSVIIGNGLGSDAGGFLYLIVIL